MMQKEFTLTNKMGLHARAAALFVKTTNRYMSDILIGKNGVTVDGKSIMCVMALGASQNSSVIISVEGPDEEEAMNEIAKIITEKFVLL